MTEKEAPAGVAPGTGAGRRSGELLLCNTGPAENPASNLFAFPRRVPCCEHCGLLVPPGSATEIAHRDRCTVPRERAAEREARIAAYRERCRQEAQTARRVAIGPKRPDGPAPLPAPVPSAWLRERLELLSAALAYPEMHERLTETTRLPLDALERVAAGRSTLAPTAWRRLLVELGR